tara:strand:- start:442 stop:573 length:132 start_codon:yes stop_codon:yes gene_type:complete
MRPKAKFTPVNKYKSAVSNTTKVTLNYVEKSPGKQSISPEKYH